jgi:hypothetical protein
VQAPQPIIVRVVEQPVESTGVADVLIGAFGLTGALVLTAVVLGAVLGGILIGIKLLRARYGPEPTGKPDAIHISPYS